MKKYTLTAPAGITSIDGITNISRSETTVIINGLAYGSPLWDKDVDHYTYTDPNQFIKRQVSILPESTSTNTLITNDGLVVVYYEVEENKYLTILDIFEQETALYDDVNPEDYQLLLNHLLEDPIRKRLFMCQTEGSYLIANNDLVYIANNVYHFYSEMDYPELETDEYGYYETTEALWLSTYNKIAEFKMLKKQFLVIEGPATMEFNGTEQDAFAALGEKKVYLIKYLDIGIGPIPTSYLNFKLKPTTSAYAGIKIY